MITTSVGHALAASSQYEGANEPATRGAVYGQGVRETDWQTPEDERDGFHLPPGFEIKLFASEPMIDKPLNMAWDHRGRLWVTTTIEYPYPAEEGEEAGDSIKILEDSNGDGRADRVATFADNLNIPMGLLPVHDGVICFSIPYIYHLKDTNGDDQADERIRLLGPFDTTRDTHGLINSLRQGSDGWIYACHGFNNHSKVAASDGSSVTLISGNTFRFKSDGSSIEQVTQGQVNPFGMTRDQWGNWYTADCHSKPLTGLLAGACYPSFGRPHDGLGFAPSMMDHLHGSTAISGVHYYQANHFPQPYRHLFYSGNVMTSRINCNRLRWQGTMPLAEELPDFLTSDDPWFRPVDVQLGQDGALYIADFYNKIIGHYEVPLDHPERDRTSGRIWRISYRNDHRNDSAPLVVDGSSVINDRSTRLDAELLAELSSPNITMRRTAIAGTLASLQAEQQARRNESLVAGFRKLLTSQDLHSDNEIDFDGELGDSAAESNAASRLRRSCLELLHRSGRLVPELLHELVGVHSNDAHLMVQVLQLVAESDHAPPAGLTAWVRGQTESSHPQIAKAAIAAVGRRGDMSDVERLLESVARHAEQDPILYQASRIATRRLLLDTDTLAAVCGGWTQASDAFQRSSEEPSATESYSNTIAIDAPLAWNLAHVLPGVDRGDAARALLAYALHRRGERDNQQWTNADEELLDTAIESASKHASETSLQPLLVAIDQLTVGNPVDRATRFDQVCSVYLSRAGRLPRILREYSEQLQQSLVSRLLEQLETFGPTSEWLDEGGETWSLEPRPTTEGTTRQMISSITRGEAYTGVLRSEPFPCPNELWFWLAGHNGLPDNPDHHKNYVRLVSMLTGQELARAYPPRDDTAKHVTWPLDSQVGNPVRVEIVDGDSAGAFAWLAVGGFSIPHLNVIAAPSVDAQVDPDRAGALLAVCTELARTDARTLVRQRLAEAELSPRQRGRILAATLAGAEQSAAAELVRHALRIDRADLIQFSLLEEQPRPRDNDSQLIELASQVASSSTAGQQRELATALLRSNSGCQMLNILFNQGLLSLQTVREFEGVLPSDLPESVTESLEGHLAEARELPADSVDVAARLAGLDWESADLAVGKQMYATHCQACHQLGGQGELIGPQLDGAVARGAERISEDILDPSRNVDKAFRTSALLLDDDTVLSGLIQANEDGTLTVTNQDGKSQTVPEESVQARRDSSQSLMPENFGELLNDHQLASLLKYLGTAAKSPSKPR